MTGIWWCLGAEEPSRAPIPPERSYIPPPLVRHYVVGEEEVMGWLMTRGARDTYGIDLGPHLGDEDTVESVTVEVRQAYRGEWIDVTAGFGVGEGVIDGTWVRVELSAEEVGDYLVRVLAETPEGRTLAVSVPVQVRV